MKLVEVLERLLDSPIIVSVQAPPQSPLDSPATLAALAICSLQEGARVFRAEGIENIEAIATATGCPVIGLLKKAYEDSPVYISPTLVEVEALLDSPCVGIALDGTRRLRPKGSTLKPLIDRIHDAGKWAMADCDTIDSVRYAIECGADLIGTTLSGYTATSPESSNPDLALVREASSLGVPIIAEGRYASGDQVRDALRLGAIAVTIGGAINDPLKMTRSFLAAARGALPSTRGPIGAVDIGGTWLRYRLFENPYQASLIQKIPLPITRDERLAWIREAAENSGAARLSISCGGTIDPASGVVWESKSFISEHLGTEFSKTTLGLDTMAINDGLATAWGLAMRPENHGKNLVVLAIGTGVGCGVARSSRLLLGRRGEYPRLNDLPFEGSTIETVLGGLFMGQNPSADQVVVANRALNTMIQYCASLYMPDTIYLCGGIGSASFVRPESIDGVEIVQLPPDYEGGLLGAAALGFWPPEVG